MIAAPHFGFVVAAYALTAATILVMIVAIVRDYRALSAALDRLAATRGAERGE
jgi:heme exporter protein CcmD